MGTLSKNQVASLLSLGADAMDNMFDVTITPPKGLTSSQNFSSQALSWKDPKFTHDLTIRADGFQPPKFNIKTYKVAYKAVEVDRPATKIEGERQFEITFRLDANYQAYKFLAAWKSLIVQASTGYATNALFGEDGDQSQAGVDELNHVFGAVSVSALARPVHMTESQPFMADGVTAGKFDKGSALTSESDTVAAPGELVKWQFGQVWIQDLAEPQYQTGGGDALTVQATFKFGNFIDPIVDQYGEDTSLGATILNAVGGLL